MTKQNFYIDIHVLQVAPPSCINRDDTGSPKTAVYGGTTRARVSSQAWKHAIRAMFKDIFAEDELGVRTKKVAEMIETKIKELDPNANAEKCLKLALDAIGKLYKDNNNDKGIKVSDDGTSKVLIFFSNAQAEAVARLAIDDCKDKKEYKKALEEKPSVDIALFGRMVADAPLLNCDAAAQVAHAISTHTVHNEYDYFTAVDDLSGEETAGAGHLGTVEFNSATLYRYATVNVNELQNSLKNLTPAAVKGFVQAFVRAMPTGKQNTFANRTYPDFVYVTVRRDQPVNLCGAFEVPVQTQGGGYLQQSVEALQKYAEKEIYQKYDTRPETEWVLGEPMNFPEILAAVEEAVKEHLTEGGVE